MLDQPPVPTDDLIVAGAGGERRRRRGVLGRHWRVVSVLAICVVVLAVIVVRHEVRVRRAAAAAAAKPVAVQGEATATGQVCEVDQPGSVVMGIEIKNVSASAMVLYEVKASLSTASSQQRSSSWQRCPVTEPQPTAATTTVEPGRTQWVSSTLSTITTCTPGMPVQIDVSYIVAGQGGGTLHLDSVTACGRS